MGINAPCSSAQAFSFQWKSSYEKVAVLYLRAAGVEERKMAQKSRDPTCCQIVTVIWRAV